MSTTPATVAGVVSGGAEVRSGVATVFVRRPVVVVRRILGGLPGAGIDGGDPEPR